MVEVVVIDGEELREDLEFRISGITGEHKSRYVKNLSEALDYIRTNKDKVKAVIYCNGIDILEVKTAVRKIDEQIPFFSVQKSAGELRLITEPIEEKLGLEKIAEIEYKPEVQFGPLTITIVANYGDYRKVASTIFSEIKDKSGNQKYKVLHQIDKPTFKEAPAKFRADILIFNLQCGKTALEEQLALITPYRRLFSSSHIIATLEQKKYDQLLNMPNWDKIRDLAAKDLTECYRMDYPWRGREDSFKRDFGNLEKDLLEARRDRLYELKSRVRVVKPKLGEVNLPVIVAGPSGAGKSGSSMDTIEELCALGGKANILLRDKTRPKRPYEKDGVHSYFISEEDFKARKQNGSYIFDFNFGGYNYGYPKDELTSLLKEGHVFIPMLDAETAREVKEKNPYFTQIVLLAHFEDLVDRIGVRATGDKEETRKRLESLKEEVNKFIELSTIADYTILNTSPKYYVGRDFKTEDTKSLQVLSTIQKFIAIINRETELRQMNRYLEPSENHKDFINGLVEKVSGGISFDELLKRSKEGEIIDLEYDIFDSDFMRNLRERHQVTDGFLRSYFPVRIVAIEEAYGRRTITFAKYDNVLVNEFIRDLFTGLLDSYYEYPKVEPKFQPVSPFGLIKLKDNSDKEIHLRDISCHYLTHHLEPFESPKIPPYALVLAFADVISEEIKNKKGRKVISEPLTPQEISGRFYVDLINKADINERVV